MPDIWRYEHDDEGFFGWLDAHSDSYFINIVPSLYDHGMLHEAKCPHFDRGDTTTWTNTEKICGETQFILERWTREELGGPPERCRDCFK